MVGFETADDAAVYVLDAQTALLLTVDFFTPIVDDPYDFGRIAAANSLSDIYAMGGRPLTAMNLVAFPCSLGPDIVAEVMRGGADVVREAGAVIVGGHTIDDPEPKYGLSIMGITHPDRVVRNVGAQPGDVLVLTKPIGTGIIATAIKRGLETEDSARRVIESMAKLNRGASEAMLAADAHAATDVTGYGLLGHLHEMLEGSGCSAKLSLSGVPIFDRVPKYSADGVRPGRTADLIAFASAFTVWMNGADQEPWMGVLADPQTSGGLLIAVAPDRLDDLRAGLQQPGDISAVVGTVLEGNSGQITVA